MSRFKRYTVKQYIDMLKNKNITRKIKEIHLHHTWKPTIRTYRNTENKEDVIWGMWRYHTQTLGWRDIGQTATLDPDGFVWACRDVNIMPASIKGRNDYAFAIEMIGDFDIGREKLEGKQLESIVELTKGLFEIFKTDRLVFHREYANKTCPGTSVQKEDLLKMIHEEKKDWRVKQGLEVINRLDKSIISSPEYWIGLIERTPDYGPLLGLIEKMVRK